MNASRPSAASCVAINSSDRSSRSRRASAATRCERAAGPRARRSAASWRFSAPGADRSRRARRLRDRRRSRSRGRCVRRLLGADRAAGQQQIFRCRQADAFRQQAGRRRREHADLDLRLAELASRPAKSRCPAVASSRPPPRHWPRTATSTGTGEAKIRRISRWKSASIAAQRSGRCSSIEAPKLKWAPVASIRMPRNCARGPRAGRRPARARRPAPRREYWPSDDPAAAEAAASVAVEPDLQRELVTAAARPSRLRGISSSIIASVQPSPLASRCRSATKSISRSCFGPSLKARNPVARLGHHVERKPGAAVFLVAVPGVELRLAQLLEALGQAFGERGQELGAQRLDLGVEQRQIDGAARHQRLAGRQGFAGQGLAVNDAAIVVEIALGFDQRVGDERAVHFQPGHDVQTTPRR